MCLRFDFLGSAPVAHLHVVVRVGATAFRTPASGRVCPVVTMYSVHVVKVIVTYMTKPGVVFINRV